YVLGAALEQLHYSQDRYWQDLRVALPHSAGLPRADQRGDVTQIGVIALSLVLGRLLRDDEYPSKVGDVVATARAVSPRGGFEPLAPALRSWISRALQLDVRQAFRNAIDASDALEQALSDSEYLASPASLEAFLARHAAAEALELFSAELPRESPPVVGAAATPAEAPAQEVPAIVQGAGAAEVAERRGDALDPGSADLDSDGADELGEPAARTVEADPPVSLLEFAPEPPQDRTGPTLEGEVPAAVRHERTTPDLPGTAARVGEAVVPNRPGLPEMAATPELAPAPEPAERSDLAERPGPTAAAERSQLTEHADRAPYPDLFGQPDPPSRGLAKWLVAAAAAATIIVAVGVPLLRGRTGATAAVQATGTLLLSTEPSGAAAVVDGQPRGMTPLTLALPAGPHVVEVRGTGSVKTVPVTVTAGAETAHYIELPTPAVALGQLMVRTDPPGASVHVDGQVRGVTPLLVADLPAGEHVVTLEAGARTSRQPVTIEPGVQSSLVVSLGLAADAGSAVANAGSAAANTAAPPVTAATSTAGLAAGSVVAPGWLAVRSPIALEVRDGDRVIGSSAERRMALPPGRYQLELSNDALAFRVTRAVQISSGQTVPLSVEVPTGLLAVNALPWADVWVDGARVGETPIGNHPLAIGVHEVLLRHPELGEQRHQVTVTGAGVSRLSADFRKP
ncbi:MAG: PEGA domain-containing protein, partial [Vicinamibacterales bacterium]